MVVVLAVLGGQTRGLTPFILLGVGLGCWLGWVIKGVGWALVCVGLDWFWFGF